MPDIWAPLAEDRHPKTYEPGQLIYLQGTEADRFYYLISGTCRSYISSESGGERVLTVHRPGDLMGEASFFDGCPRVSSAVAITKCKAVSIEWEQLGRVFESHPGLALPMLQYLARTVRMLSAHVDNMSFLQADQRVARYLLSLPEEQGGMVRCTHEELGAAVGVSRVTVSRAINRFAKNGWLRTGYGAVILLDRNALHSFSTQD